jgi:hypothetical protein
VLLEVPNPLFRVPYLLFRVTHPLLHLHGGPRWLLKLRSTPRWLPEFAGAVRAPLDAGVAVLQVAADDARAFVRLRPTIRVAGAAVDQIRDLLGSLFRHPAKHNGVIAKGCKVRAKVKRRDHTEVQDLQRKMGRRVAWSAWQQDASSLMLAGPDAFRYPQHE